MPLRISSLEQIIIEPQLLSPRHSFVLFDARRAKMADAYRASIVGWCYFDYVMMLRP